MTEEPSQKSKISIGLELSSRK